MCVCYRFLQGPGTDDGEIDKMREAASEGDCPCMYNAQHSALQINLIYIYTYMYVMQMQTSHQQAGQAWRQGDQVTSITLRRRRLGLFSFVHSFVNSELDKAEKAQSPPPDDDASAADRLVAKLVGKKSASASSKSDPCHSKPFTEEGD